jgi:hypothetical protein
MNFKKLKRIFFSYPRNNIMKVLAAVGVVGATTFIFIKREKIREAAEKIKNKIKKAS